MDGPREDKISTPMTKTDLGEKKNVKKLATIITFSSLECQVCMPMVLKIWRQQRDTDFQRTHLHHFFFLLRPRTTIYSLQRRGCAHAKIIYHSRTINGVRYRNANILQYTVWQKTKTRDRNFKIFSSSFRAVIIIFS